VAPLLAVVAGAALYALGLPPFDFAVAGWVALVPLLLGVRGRDPRSAFVFGALYGCACAVAVGGSWIFPALARFFATWLVAATALGLVYALVFWGSSFGLFAAAAAVLFRRPATAGRRLALAAAWVASEALRGRALGQPWGLLGYTQHAHIALIQLAAVTGVYGVSFLLALASATIADAVVALRAREFRRVPRIVGPPIGLVGTLWLLGAAIVAGGPAGGFGAHTVAIVQTNVPPERDWTRAYTDRQLAAHVEATRTLAAAHPALVVWPEHAVPRYLETEPELGAMLAGIAQRNHTDILFGAPRYEDGRTYNSVRLITAAGRNGGAYDKRRLVLLAEHNPLSHDAADTPADDPHQFSAGEGPGVLASFVPLGVTICHEILFPELVTASVEAGAALLVNVSNDGWLDGGHGIASRQHFAMAVLRAVETRRYLVRAATTGVSGVVDPYGRVVGTLAPGAIGTLAVPVAGRTRVTPYVRFGDAFALLCSLSTVLALGVRRPALRLRARTAIGGAPTPSDVLAPTRASVRS